MATQEELKELEFTSLEKMNIRLIGEVKQLRAWNKTQETFLENYCERIKKQFIEIQTLKHDLLVTKKAVRNSIETNS